MPIGPNSASVRIFLSDEDVELRNKFKQLVAVAGTSMSRRMALFIEKDVAYWEATGQIMDIEALNITKSEKSDKLERLDELMDKLNNLVNVLQNELHRKNGHSPQHKKVDDPWDNPESDDDDDYDDDDDLDELVKNIKL